MKTPIEFQSDFSQLDHWRACKAAIDHIFPSFKPLVQLSFFLIVLGFVLSIFLDRIGESLIQPFIGVLPLFAALGLVAVSMQRQSRVRRAVNEAPYRTGLAEVSIDETAIQICYPGMTTKVFWSHVVDVIELDGNLVVLSGAAEPHIIPSNSLPQSVDLSTLKRHLESWSRTETASTSLPPRQPT